MKKHLDHELYDRLLGGELSEEQEGRLLSHLREDCGECEAFMAGLDGQQLWILMNTIAKATEPDPLVPEEVTETPWYSRGVFRRTPVLLSALGFASLVLIVLGVVFVHNSFWDEEETSRTKGLGILTQSRSVVLSIGKVVSRGSGSVRIERIEKGGVLTQEQRLTFRIDTDGPCFLYLACISGAAVEILYPAAGSASVYHEGGSLIPEIDGHPASLSLKTYKGRLSFVAVCTARPFLNPQEDLMWLAEGSEMSTGEHLPIESLDMAEFIVIAEDGKP